MNVKISVNRRKAITLSDVFEKEMGKFRSTYPSEMSSKINNFTFNDIELVECPRDKISGTSFAFFLSNTLKLVALDGFHAMAIFEDVKNIHKLNDLLKEYWWRKDFHLETITFFGDTAISEDNRRNFFCFKYEKKYENPIFLTYDNEPGWNAGSDLALVFKEEFIKKTFPPKKEENFKKKKS